MPLASLHKDKKKIGRAFESELLYRFSFDFNIAFMPYSLTAIHPFLFLQVIVDTTILRTMGILWNNLETEVNA